MITLYQYELSPFCDKIRRILNVKGVEYKIEEVTMMDTLKGRTKKLSPVAKLPIIDDDMHVVWDSTDIALYLEEKYPQNPLIPSDPKLKAQVQILEDWADESLYFYEMHLRLCVPHNAKRWVPVATHKDPKFIQSIAPFLVPRMLSQQSKAQGMGKKTLKQIEAELHRHCSSIQDWLGKDDFLVNNQLTLADISVYCQMECILGTQEGASVFSHYPVVADWMDRIQKITAPGGLEEVKPKAKAAPKKKAKAAAKPKADVKAADKAKSGDKAKSEEKESKSA